MNAELFCKLLKSQAVHKLRVDEVYSENDEFYNAGILAASEYLSWHTILERVRERWRLFIWISPVALNGEIVGYTYDAEYTLQENNTFSDMDYSKYPTYDSCKTAAINHAFKHAVDNKYQLNMI